MEKYTCKWRSTFANRKVHATYLKVHDANAKVHATYAKVHVQMDKYTPHTQKYTCKWTSTWRILRKKTLHVQK